MLKRSPPPTSRAAFSLTCIGPCGAAGLARHIFGSLPWLDSAPSTAFEMRSSSLVPALPATAGSAKPQAEIPTTEKHNPSSGVWNRITWGLLSSNRCSDLTSHDEGEQGRSAH